MRWDWPPIAPAGRGRFQKEKTSRNEKGQTDLSLVITEVEKRSVGFCSDFRRKSRGL